MAEKNFFPLLPPEGERIRNIVVQTPEYQFVSIRWGANSDSGEHDHPGITYGRTLVVAGIFEETRDGITQRYFPGDTFHEYVNTVHRVKTVTGGLTDHFYAPGLDVSKMKVTKDPAPTV